MKIASFLSLVSTPLVRAVVSLVLVVGISLPSQAAVYKYVDKKGNVTFTNVPIRGSVPVPLAPLAVYSTPGKSSASTTTRNGGNANVNHTNTGIPTVSPLTQKQRDVERRKILEQELANEQKALSTAQNALNEGKAIRNGNERNYQKYLDRVQKLQDAVTDHQKNITALQKELAQN